jgi:hypothetical protein
VANCFQVIEKGHDLLARQLFNCQVAGIALLPRYELQEEFEAVTVAVKGIGTHCPLPWDIIG